MMIKNKKVDLRLKTLKHNIDAVNECNNDTLKDTVLECGIGYHKKYPYNEETINLFNKHEALQKHREEKLFSSILNFTQTFYSIKEYLVKEYPSKEVIIENFFSNEKVKMKSRKEISNDLKHNPEKDLKFGIGEVSREIILEPKKRIEKINMRKTWFYSGIDAVEYCNILFRELLELIEINFNESE